MIELRKIIQVNETEYILGYDIESSCVVMMCMNLITKDYYTDKTKSKFELVKNVVFEKIFEWII